MEFTPVDCPACGTRVMEIGFGVARGKCPHCKRRVLAGKTRDGALRILLVDRPPVRRETEPVKISA